MRDLWTHSANYRKSYQTDDDVEAIITLLDLDGAMALVDVGCGNGAFAIAAAGRYPGCRVRAFDALESAVAECRRRAEGAANIVAQTASAHALPLADDAADRVLCRSVLHHIAEPDAVYREISRVLKPDGKLVLQTPCNYWEPAFDDVLSGMMMQIDDTHHRYYYRPAEIVAGLESAGFRADEPECWTYDFPYLDDRAAEFVRQHHGDERLRLRAIGDGKWSIENYWCRVVATKLSAV